MYSQSIYSFLFGWKCFVLLFVYLFTRILPNLLSKFIVTFFGLCRLDFESKLFCIKTLKTTNIFYIWLNDHLFKFNGCVFSFTRLKRCAYENRIYWVILFTSVYIHLLCIVHVDIKTKKKLFSKHHAATKKYILEVFHFKGIRKFSNFKFQICYPFLCALCARVYFPKKLLSNFTFKVMFWYSDFNKHTLIIFIEWGYWDKHR